MGQKLRNIALQGFFSVLFCPALYLRRKLLDLIRRRSPHSILRVSIYAESKSGIVVTETFLQRFNIYACGDRNRGEGVTKIVHPDVVDTDIFQMPHQATVDGTAFQPPACGVREHRAGILPLISGTRFDGFLQPFMIG